MDIMWWQVDGEWLACGGCVRGYGWPADVTWLARGWRVVGTWRACGRYVGGGVPGTRSTAKMPSRGPALVAA